MLVIGIAGTELAAEERDWLQHRSRDSTGIPEQMP